MRRTYLCTCCPGDVVEDVFVITGKQFSATQTGKYFIKAFLSDRTLQITARLWNATRDLFNAIPDSGFVKIRGRIENYQGNLQLIIEQIWPAKEAFDLSDLIPHTTKNISKMCARLVELLDSIQNRHLSALMHAYIDDEKLMEQVCKAPAAMGLHHAFIGGLLEHTLNSIEVADALCRFYPGLNRDLVIAGIFLHDIAKIWELSYDCAFGYTDGGQLVGHIAKAVVWIEQRRLIAEETLGEKIPQPLVDVLQHIVISHHGVPEFGAIKAPATPEAIAVHFIENLDAKLQMSLAATRSDNSASADGNWTEYMKAFGGRLYRPDTAPAEADIVIEPDPQAEPSRAPTLNMPVTNPLFETAPAAPKKR